MFLSTRNLCFIQTYVYKILQKNICRKPLQLCKSNSLFFTQSTWIFYYPKIRFMFWYIDRIHIKHIHKRKLLTSMDDNFLLQICMYVSFQLVWSGARPKTKNAAARAQLAHLMFIYVCPGQSVKNVDPLVTCLLYWWRHVSNWLWVRAPPLNEFQHYFIVCLH